MAARIAEAAPGLDDLAHMAAGVRHGRHLSLPGRDAMNVESAGPFDAAPRAFRHPETPGATDRPDCGSDTSR